MSPPALPELPIRYFEASAMMAVFPAPLAELERRTPAGLEVVPLWPGRAPLVISCFDYLSSTAGAYGEIGVSWPVVTQRRLRVPVLPLLFETRWPTLGFWVHRLPVTTDLALRAGRTLWGYPKTLAQIDYDWRQAHRRCRWSEDGAEVLTLTLDTRMPARPERFPVVTYSQLGAELLRTRIQVDAVGLRRRAHGAAALTLGPHPAGRELASLGLDRAEAMQVRWYPTWRAELPRAEWRTPAQGSAAAPAARGAA
ncbi:MAG: acetoacetate decarboxylase family protein [Deltaproteobacteria bacterium]|nr:acetoacetate decarboxylase family protein [Deltaproteobacteria bacterium]